MFLKMKGEKAEIAKYSDPMRVESKAHAIFGDDVHIEFSSRPNKKYMLLNPKTKKFVHFGQMGYVDYTRHRDEQRRARFRKRNAKWQKSKSRYSPAFLSYNLLW